MKIELQQMIENEDGSADCILDVDEEGKEYLLNLGFNTLLRNALDHIKANEEK